jgi:hypothetical protein
MDRFFQLLIFFILCYLLVKFVRNLFGAAFGKKQQAGFAEKPEGKVTIDYIPPKQEARKINKEDAETVEFEEIK